ncbi:MAG: DNA polymerase III subunit delta [SAR202 cluster bacterium Io17-Chloro-G9]|nr:MAG: DNA polymerase III subunit delta [SAR202 cluster bacterium Io17-Chloro-G9]
MTAHVLHGDGFLVRQALKRLQAEAGLEDLLEGNRHLLDGRQIKEGELLAICNALPFMDIGRLILVQGLLATQVRRAGRGRGARSAPSSSSTNGWRELAQAVPAMPETTLLVFLEGPLAETNPLLRLLRPVAQVQELNAPAGEALARWIRESAQEKGASISPAALASLADQVGNDLWTLDQELEKLSLYASGRGIEERDVKELVSQVREANIFAAVDAMIDGKPALALRLLHQLREGGREVSTIIAMVERQLRLMALARDSLDEGLAQRELGQRLGVTSQFVIRKTVDQARRHSWDDITWRYNRLLEADLAIKRGRLEPDLALELLVADQAGRGRG